MPVDLQQLAGDVEHAAVAGGCKLARQRLQHVRQQRGRLLARALQRGLDGPAAALHSARLVLEALQDGVQQGPGLA